MDKVLLQVAPCSKWTHINVILVGLEMLSRDNKIELKIEGNRENKGFNYSDPSGIELKINDKLCYVDVSDGYNNLDFIKENIDKYDFYFKRSFSEDENAKYGFKMIPLGLNYEVFEENARYIFKQNALKKIIPNAIGQKYYDEYYLEDLECKKEIDVENPKICFTARLWEGKNTKELNNNRIKLVRLLKENFGKNFYGGICYSKLAKQLCPDLIVSKFSSNREKYLKRMHNCDICIASTGLHKSIGWKFAEYVIAGKVILSEPLNYYVSDNFKENENYITFNNPEDCIEKIKALMEDKDKMKAISNNNFKYYDEELRPDKMVERIIEIVLNPKF